MYGALNYRDFYFLSDGCRQGLNLSDSTQTEEIQLRYKRSNSDLRLQDPDQIQKILAESMQTKEIQCIVRKTHLLSPFSTSTRQV